MRVFSIGIGIFLLFSGVAGILLAGNDVLKDVSISLLASGIVLLVFDTGQIILNRRKTKFFLGKFHRVRIFEVQHGVNSGNKYVELPYSEVKELIDIARVGKWFSEFEFQGKATYAHGQVTFQFQLSPNSVNHGNGNYEYIGREADNLDAGTYEIIRLVDHPGKIIVYYRNIVGNGNAEGYEIWEKAPG